jgi:hypothetical protein
MNYLQQVASQQPDQNTRCYVTASYIIFLLLPYVSQASLASSPSLINLLPYYQFCLADWQTDQPSSQKKKIRQQNNQIKFTGSIHHIAWVPLNDVPSTKKYA